MIPSNWHGALPWKQFRHWYRWKRSRFFSLPRQEGTYLRVQTDGDPIETIERVFGSESYAPRWELSYDRQEDLNLARVVWDDRDEFDEKWWQYHLRAYLVDDSTIEIRGHYETETTEHPDAHLDAVGYNTQRGMDKFKRILDAEGLEWAEVEWREDD